MTGIRRIDKGRTKERDSRVKRMVRLMQMIVIMQSGDAASISSLCSQFSIGRRTVFRDMELLRKVGLPIVVDEDRGGYTFLRRQSLRCPQLEVAEIFLLILAVRSFSAAAKQHVASILKNAISKILASSIHEFSAQAIEITDLVAQTSKTVSLEKMIENGLAEIQSRRR